MSERIQRRAAARRDLANQREQNARERAEKNRQRGEGMLERLHATAADLQGDAARAAQTLLELDTAAEGDQLSG